MVIGTFLSVYNLAPIAKKIIFMREKMTVQIVQLMLFLANNFFNIN